EAVVRIDVCAERSPRLHVDDAGVDRVAAEAAGDRNSMVPVDDVIAVADAIDVDRWQLIALRHGRVHTRPAVAQTPRGRKETGVEVGGLGRGRRRPDDLA